MQTDGSIKKILYPEYMSLNSMKKISLSLVVPAYNEEQRLPVMLTETINVEKLTILI